MYTLSRIKSLPLEDLHMDSEQGLTIWTAIDCLSIKDVMSLVGNWESEHVDEELKNIIHEKRYNIFAHALDNISPWQREQIGAMFSDLTAEETKQLITNYYKFCRKG
jgi:hypothetical protein